MDEDGQLSMAGLSCCLCSPSNGAAWRPFRSFFQQTWNGSLEDLDPKSFNKGIVGEVQVAHHPGIKSVLMKLGWPDI